jgi:hypothetical protein
VPASVRGSTDEAGTVVAAGGGSCCAPRSGADPAHDEDTPTNVAAVMIDLTDADALNFLVPLMVSLLDLV